jgi:hypothetical protein
MDGATRDTTSPRYCLVIVHGIGKFSRINSGARAPLRFIGAANCAAVIPRGLGAAGSFQLTITSFSRSYKGPRAPHPRLRDRVMRKDDANARARVIFD